MHYQCSTRSVANTISSSLPGIKRSEFLSPVLNCCSSCKCLNPFVLNPFPPCSWHVSSAPRSSNGAPLPPWLRRNEVPQADPQLRDVSPIPFKFHRPQLPLPLVHSKHQVAGGGYAGAAYTPHSRPAEPLKAGAALRSAPSRRIFSPHSTNGRRAASRSLQPPGGARRCFAAEGRCGERAGTASRRSSGSRGSGRSVRRA